MPLSVMIPTFNRVEYLRLAINSVVAQTKAIDELVIADAGSTDGTLQYLEEVKANHFPNLKIVGKPSRVENWMDGIDACTCDYVLILCDDDFIHRRLVENFDKLINTNANAAMYCFRQQIVNFNYKYPKTSITKDWSSGFCSGAEAELELIKTGFPGFPSIVFNRHLLKFDATSLCVFSNANYICDLFLAPQAILNGGIVFDNYIASTFYFHPHSQSIVQGLSLFYPDWDKKIQLLRDSDLKKLSKHFKTRYVHRLLATLVISSYCDGKKGIEQICNSLKVDLENLNAPLVPKLLIIFGSNYFVRKLLNFAYFVRKSL